MLLLLKLQISKNHNRVSSPTIRVGGPVGTLLQTGDLDDIGQECSQFLSRASMATRVTFFLIHCRTRRDSCDGRSVTKRQLLASSWSSSRSASNFSRVASMEAKIVPVPSCRYRAMAPCEVASYGILGSSSPLIGSVIDEIIVARIVEEAVKQLRIQEISVIIWVLSSSAVPNWVEVIAIGAGPW